MQRGSVMKRVDEMPPIDVMGEPLSIVRLPPDAATPSWASGGSWCSVTRTEQELSVVCESARVPAEIGHNGPWRALRVAGPLDFGMTGVLERIARPLAEARISIFAVSTFDTDYVLVGEADLENAVLKLGEAGIVVRTAD